MRWLALDAPKAAIGSQLVHCPSFVAPWRLPVPYVLTVHDTSTIKFPGDHPLEWRGYTNFFLPERARSAKYVITGTEHARGEIVRDLRVPAERVVVTPYGVSKRFVVPVTKRAAIADPPVILFPGAPTKRKNLDVVLTAMVVAADQSILRRARLAISGASAAHFPHHVERIKALGLTSRVEWLSKVPSEAMPGLIGNADLVVYPSLHEGFGFPALEAMASGTPVLASSAACLPEVLGDGAVLVSPTDVRAFIIAAEALLSDVERRAAVTEKGRLRAAQFTWTRCADLTVDVYRKALSAVTQR